MNNLEAILWLFGLVGFIATVSILTGWNAANKAPLCDDSSRPGDPPCERWPYSF